MSGYSDDFDRRDDRWDDRDPRDAAARAKEKVRGPAIALLVVGVISLLASGLGILNAFSMDQQFAQIEEQWDNDPKLTPQQKADMKQMLATYKDAIKIAIPIMIGLGVITALITIFGAIQMMSLSSRGLAMTGSILSMLPFVSGCCCLGLPIGIWVLLVLARPEVKAGFAAAASPRSDQY